MAKKTVLKVNMYCGKCKTQVLKAVTKLSDIDQVSLDAEKGTVTVVGDVDPVCLVKNVRKTGKIVHIESVGPDKKPDPPSKPSTCVVPLPPCDCMLVPVRYFPSPDYRVCSIL